MLPLTANITATRASADSLQASAHNLANVNTEGFQGQQVVQSTGSNGQGVRTQVSPTHAPAPVILRDGQLRAQSNTDVVKETITHVEAAAAFRSNMGVMQVHDRLTEAVLDIVA